MTKQYNYYKIGLFVALSLSFLVVIFVTLAGGDLFEKKEYIETYFNESVDGLQEGSTVKYLGIDIGHVDTIELLKQIYPSLQGEPSGSRFIYVKIDITADKFVNKRFIDSLPNQIEKGLRAQIQPQGLTGTAYLSLTFLPPDANPPIQLHVNLQHQYTYVPSATSTFTRVTDAVDNFFSSMQQNNIPLLIKNINTLTVAMNTALQQADVAGISQDTRKALLTAADTARQYRLVGEQLLSLLKKKEVNESIDNIAALTHSLQETTLLANKTLIGLNAAVENSNQILMQFKVNEQGILSNAEETSNNLNVITNNAKEYPSQLLFSKPPPHLDPSTL